MKTARTLTLGLLVGSLIALAQPALAGCGGNELTLNFEEIKFECGAQIDQLTTHALEHQLDAHVERNERRYDAADVIFTKVQLYAFEEMAGAVRSLVTRSERMTDQIAADDALRVAEETLLSLPLADYLTIEDFLEENRSYARVNVPLGILLQYLKDSGTPDLMIVAVEEAADDC